MSERGECPDENAIVGFLEGALSMAEREQIEAHCAGCERCREGLAHAAHDSTVAASGWAGGGAPALVREIEAIVHGVVEDAHAGEAAAGTRIGRFEIIAVQGRGQFGVVYRARDTQLGRMVAVKVMRRTGRAAGPLLETLFRTEAEAAARLQHPSIVTLHDHGEFDGAPYLVLELLEGETLRSRLERGARLAPPDALAIAIAVAGALVEAHAAGVIHRDIKPGNVFLCASGQIKVLDFGLALLQCSVDHADAAEPGAAALQAGTPRYMAPELFRDRAADACTDVYAVGVMLLETLVGPATGNRPIVERVAAARLSPPLRRLVSTATALDRDHRFQDAAQLLAALARTRRRLARRRSVRVGAALAAALIAATAAVAYRGAAPSHRARPAVAVLGFSNLSGRSDTAWLATALTEMLDTDLASSPAIQVASRELVARARADLGLSDTERPSPRASQDLRRYLGIDYAVTGSYLSVASQAGGQTRLDVQIEDTQGQLLDSVSETGGDGELLDLVARIASRLRVRLAGAAITQDEARRLRASMPRATDAVRLYSDGLRRRRRADLLEARDLLARAVVAEPGFALAHSEFSQVLHALGEEARMREEARIAFERSGDLPTDERWLVEARYHEAFDRWPQARELRRNLHEQFPDDLEYGLELADALDRHAQKRDALTVIAELRRLPPPQRDDPRLDLAEASAQEAYRTRKAFAIAAAEKAHALGARWVLARAREREAGAERQLGELDHSLAAAEEARAICEAMGDREGRSIALYEIASTRALRGDPLSTVIAVYEQALQIEREIGNPDQIANMLGNIAFQHLMAGDPAKAALRLDDMEPLAKTGARIYAAEYRAIQWQEQGDLARAFAQLEQIRESGKTRGFELELLGEILMAQGQLAQARVRFEQFLARDWPSADDARVLGLLAMSRLEVEDGQAAHAEARAREAVAICERAHNDAVLVTAQAVLAGVLVAEHRFEDAELAARTALGRAERTETMPEWIDARIALARAVAGLHPGELDAALAEAQAALDRARERGLVGSAYEARLAAGEIAARGHRAYARAELRRLADEAGAHGFHLVARKARAAADPPSSRDP